MSTFSWPLQRALVTALSHASAVVAIAGARVLDGPVSGSAVDGPTVMLGDETVAPWSTATDTGAEHRISISVVAQAQGFSVLKPLAAAVCEAVLGPMPLDRGRIVNAAFLGARTGRDPVRQIRRIDLTFRIVIEDDAQISGE